MAPTVSILINNYNYGRFLRAAVDSALSQTYAHTEVVVVDDGSTDESRFILAQYSDRIRVVLKDQGGQASAFNAGFDVSRGDIVSLLDSDDMIAPDKAARLVDIFTANPNAGWCFDRTRYFRDGEDHASAVPRPLPPNVTFGPWDVRSIVCNEGYAPYIPAPTSALSFRRELLSKILPMPVAANVRLSDAYLKFLAVGLSPGILAKDELSLQRLHESNAYTGAITKRDQLAAQIDLTTSLYLLQREPQMRLLAIRMASRGLVLCWLNSAIDEVYWETARGVLRQVCFRECLLLVRFGARELINRWRMR